MAPPDTSATVTQLPKLPAFKSSELDFEVYMTLIETNFEAYGITDAAKKKSLLLVSVGTQVFGTLANLAAPDSPTDLDYKAIVKLLKAGCPRSG